jgi:acyl carrier protein
MDSLYQRLAEKLEANEVHREDVLQDFPEWDSLTILAVLAMIDADYNVQVHTDDLLKMTTVGDLVDFVNSKRSENV